MDLSFEKFASILSQHFIGYHFNHDFTLHWLLPTPTSEYHFTLILIIDSDFRSDLNVLQSLITLIDQFMTAKLLQ